MARSKCRRATIRTVMLVAGLLVARAGVAKPRVIEVVLTTEGFAKTFGSVSDKGELRFDGRIPRLFVYSKGGGRTAVITGYAPTLIEQVTAGLAAQGDSSAPRLADLLTVVRRPDGADTGMEAVMSPGGVVAEFQASWCLPCRAVRRDLESLDESVTVLSIEADTRRVNMKAVYQLLVPRE